jgi:hypothetical protein
MPRALVGFIVAGFLSACAINSGEVKRTVVIGGQVSCAKHRISLITVRGFEAEPLMLVHSADPRSVPCDERAPNRIWDSQHLIRTSLHPVRGIVTYCPRCEAEYTECLAGYRLSDSDVQHIRALVLRRADVRETIIRIVAVDTGRALVDAGREEHVGDVFDDVGVTKRQGRWHIPSSIDAHKVIATGQLLRWIDRKT